jgi:hypothetical protein
MVSYGLLPFEEYFVVAFWLWDAGLLLAFGAQEFSSGRGPDLIYSLLPLFESREWPTNIASFLVGAAIGGFMLLPVVGLNGVFKDNPVTRQNIGKAGWVLASTYAMFLLGMGTAHLKDFGWLLWQSSAAVRISAAIGLLVYAGFGSAVLLGLRDRRDKWSARGAMDEALRWYAKNTP